MRLSRTRRITAALAAIADSQTDTAGHLERIYQHVTETVTFRIVPVHDDGYVYALLDCGCTRYLPDAVWTGNPGQVITCDQHGLSGLVAFGVETGTSHA